MSANDAAWLLDALEDSANGWSLGTFGAIAEFVRDPDEPFEIRRDARGVSASTDRGAFRLRADPKIVPVAYETPNSDGETWSQSVALCLPVNEEGMHRRTVLTEIGGDTDAVRERDQGAILFDMGLGAPQVDVCIRTADPDLIAQLRSEARRSIFEAGNPAMTAIVAAGPHRVFLCRFGRAEVFQPIPPPDGVSPEGPHTHVLPRLLRTGRTHAATTPIPDGLVPCAHLFPPSPLRDQFGRRRSFDADAYAAFQALFARYGTEEARRIKRAVSAAIDAGSAPASFDLPEGRHARAAVRTAIRQAMQTRGERGCATAWSRHYDHGPSEAPEDDEQPVH